MHELGRITTRIKLGGGLNLLCIASAGYVFVKTMTKIVEFNNAVKQGEALDTLIDNCIELNEMIKKKSEENAEENEEAAE